ncbi:helix-turn-helix transcriptional regulator, partial [Streptomyces sp. NPDC005395]|uniref:helix-turn-helix domain-containing protein n=1 Tax=Streptomyces sp. NPDC005395 TaxID=3157042 RepID=UPI0033ACFCC1
MPDELDPQIREFTSQLRRLVDRSELSVASVADATGYSKTSWERYLNGRLLAPKGAIVALAEVTRTNPVHLTTMWELAERAWSRSEMRHDMTMEAIRISQARAALGELGTPAAKSGNSAAKSGGRDRSGGATGRGSRSGRHGGGAAAASGIAGPAGVSPTLPPTVPAQPTAADSPDSVLGAVRGGGGPGAPAPSPGGATEGNSWGLAGYRGPAPTGDRTARPRTGTGAAGGGGRRPPPPG